ncbi:MAG: transposase [Chloroflexi bacterium]|nr:transposase [Chloroflexota bacterium]
MYTQYDMPLQEAQAAPFCAQLIAQDLGRDLARFLYPLLVTLDQRLDKRLVRTFLQTIAVIITFRDRMHGLWLSELGGHLLGPEHERAGTKRISNLLHSPNWRTSLIEDFLLQQATSRLQEISALGDEGLVIWDEGVLEKAESLKLEGLSAVRSSKARRLTRIKPGYYTPPRGPIFVPGVNTLGLIVVGLHERSGPPQLAVLRCWTGRGPLASKKREQEVRVLLSVAMQWGRGVIHIFDQGFAGSPWLGMCLQCLQRVVVRWAHNYQLIDEQGRTRKAWEIARGKRPWGRRQIWDARRRTWRMVGVLAFPVRHPDYPQVPLWLVVSRPGKGHKPWYLLTNEEVSTERQAWRVVFAYARRWQIEMTWRFGKSELGWEGPRLHKWEVRLKLLLMAALAYAFLLTRLGNEHLAVRCWLLRHYCHRTGQRARQTAMPLYRLRLAISRLWQEHPPDFVALARRRSSEARPPTASVSRITVVVEEAVGLSQGSFV